MYPHPRPCTSRNQSNIEIKKIAEKGRKLGGGGGAHHWIDVSVVPPYGVKNTPRDPSG
jgi:hypothetical protein